MYRDTLASSGHTETTSWTWILKRRMGGGNKKGPGRRKRCRLLHYHRRLQMSNTSSSPLYSLALLPTPLYSTWPGPSITQCLFMSTMPIYVHTIHLDFLLRFDFLWSVLQVFLMWGKERVPFEKHSPSSSPTLHHCIPHHHILQLPAQPYWNIWWYGEERR